MMLTILIWLMIGHGMTYAVVKSKMAHPFRELYNTSKNSYTNKISFKLDMFFYTMFNCMVCTGFWIGNAMSLLFNPVGLPFNGFLLISFILIVKGQTDVVEK